MEEGALPGIPSSVPGHHEAQQPSLWGPEKEAMTEPHLWAMRAFHFPAPSGAASHALR